MNLESRFVLQGRYVRKSHLEKDRLRRHVKCIQSQGLNLEEWSYKDYLKDDFKCRLKLC